MRLITALRQYLVFKSNKINLWVNLFLHSTKRTTWVVPLFSMNASSSGNGNAKHGVIAPPISIGKDAQEIWSHKLLLYSRSGRILEISIKANWSY